MNAEQFGAIVGDVISGIAVRKALAAHGVNPRAFYAAIDADEELAKRYARAKATGCHAWADETHELADEPPPRVETQFGSHVDAGWVQWQRNRIELRKWHLAKLLPKVYGERTMVSNDPDNPIPPMVVVAPYTGPGSDGSSAAGTD